MALERVERKFPLRVGLRELPAKFVLRENPPIPLLRKQGETTRLLPCLTFLIRNLARNLDYLAERIERLL